MSSLRIRLRDALIQRINAGRPIDVPEATSRRWLPGDETTLPAISVWVDNESRRLPRGSARFGGPEERDLRILVQVINTTVDADDAEVSVERILEWVDDRLGDTTLDNVALAVTVERIVWEVVQSERLYTTATLQCLIQYQTTRGDSSLSQ